MGRHGRLVHQVPGDVGADARRAAPAQEQDLADGHGEVGTGRVHGHGHRALPARTQLGHVLEELEGPLGAQGDAALVEAGWPVEETWGKMT